MGGTVCQNVIPPYSYTHSFLSAIKHLRKIRRLGYKQFFFFLLYFNSLKKLFVSKTKFNCFLKLAIFHTHCFQKYSNAEDQV